MAEREVPELLARYHARCMPTPPAAPSDAMIVQEGEIRLGEDRPFMPFTAEQWLAATRTAFCWHARFRMAPLVTGVVEDAFEDGRGRLDAKIWGVLPVAHARGAEVDRGEVQRYLAELPWCPAAIMHNPELRFDEAEHGDVRVRHGDDRDAWVDLRFDAAGDIVGAYTTTRHRDDQVHPWEGVFEDYADFGGVRVPSKAHVSWHMPDGRYTYFRARVTSFAWRGSSPARA